MNVFFPFTPARDSFCMNEIPGRKSASFSTATCAHARLLDQSVLNWTPERQTPWSNSKAAQGTYFSLEEKDRLEVV